LSGLTLPAFSPLLLPSLTVVVVGSATVVVVGSATVVVVVVAAVQSATGIAQDALVVVVPSGQLAVAYTVTPA
jgi:hypothetical protein